MTGELVFVQCPEPGCGLRFPGEPGVSCPLCKASCPEVALRSPNRSRKPGTPPRPMCCLVDNVRSVFNVGSLFRTADGAGVARLMLGGITPTPEHPAMAKTALGAEHAVPWTHGRSSVELAEAARKDGETLWALEATPGAKPLAEVVHHRPQRLTLVVGNEVCGVDPGVLERCDMAVYLPMAGTKTSLNVASAFAVAVYSLI